MLEAEYIQQAKYNNRLAGNPSKAVPNSMRFISKTGKVLGAVGVLTTYGIATYDVINGNANTSTWVEVGATSVLFGAAIIGAPIVAGVAVVGGITYGGVRLFFGNQIDNWINRNWGYNND